MEVLKLEGQQLNKSRKKKKLCGIFFFFAKTFYRRFGGLHFGKVFMIPLTPLLN